MSEESNRIITVAPIGGITKKSDNPAIPITVPELVECVVACANLGVSIAHIHVRDEQGNNSLSYDLYKEAISEIRRRSQILICISTSKWNVTEKPSLQDKVRLLELNPDLVSFHIASFNRGMKLFHNDPEEQSTFLSEIIERGIIPEFEVFDSGSIFTVLELNRKGKLKHAPYFQFLFGMQGGCTDEAIGVDLFSKACKGCEWNAGGIGRLQFPSNLRGLLNGGGARTGFEDNVYLSRGVLAKNNEELVRRLVDAAKSLGNRIATPEEARARLRKPA